MALLREHPRTQNARTPSVSESATRGYGSPTEWLTALSVALCLLMLLMLVGTFLSHNASYFQRFLPQRLRARHTPDRGNLVPPSRQPFLPLSPASFLRDSCTTSSCLTLADLINVSVRRSADPCHSFNEYVCGGLAVNTPNLRQKLAEDLAVREMVFLSSTPEQTRPVRVSNVVVTTFTSCIRNKTFQDVLALQSFLNRSAVLSNGTAPRPSLIDVMLKLAVTVQNGILIHIDVHGDATSHPRSKNLMLRLGLNPRFTRWVEEKKSFQRSQPTYKDFVARLLKLIWVKNGEEFQESCHKLETVEAVVHHALAAAFRTEVDADDAVMAIEDLGKHSRHLTGGRLLEQLNRRARYLGIPLYTSADAIVIEGRGVFAFLDNVLSGIEVQVLTLYLAWETARQMEAFVSSDPLVQKRDYSCYAAVEELFGAEVSLAPLVHRTFTDKTRKFGTEVFAAATDASASILEHSDVADAGDKARVTRAVQKLRTMTVKFVAPGEDKKNWMTGFRDKLKGKTFLEDYLRTLAVLWRRKMNMTSEEYQNQNSKANAHYDPLTNTLRVPITHLLPPLFSHDGILATNMGTLGPSMSAEVWRALHDEEVGGFKATTVRTLADFHARKTRCLRRRGGSLETGDVFRVVAMGSLVEAFGRALWTQPSMAPWKSSLQLFFVAVCLPDCVGSRPGIGQSSTRYAASPCNVVVMNVPAFAKAFECPELRGPERSFCDF